jgi:hypothetical protein
MSMTFDPQIFMQTTVNEALSTAYINVPEGEYSACVGEIGESNLREIQTKDGPRVVLDVPWLINDERVAEITHKKESRVRQSVFLDVIQDTNGKIIGLDMSKGANVQLGKLREVLGQNQPGKPWAFGMLTGNMAIVEVTHTIDGEKVYANVTSVRK